MLSIAKLVARAEDYYLRTVAAGREEYYTGAGESPGYWLGQGATRLGLSGEVAPADLRAVLAGVSPQGEILTAGGVADARRVAGFDLTFSAPKSVSLLYGLSGRDVSATVRAVHADAVAQALDYLERRALRVRRGSGDSAASGHRGSSVQPSCTAPRAPATLSSIPTSWWPTSPWGTTAPGRPPTPG